MREGPEGEGVGVLLLRGGDEEMVAGLDGGDEPESADGDGVGVRVGVGVVDGELDKIGELGLGDGEGDGEGVGVEDGVAVGVIALELDKTVELELAEGVGVEDAADFWYRFKRFPAPQYSVLLPAHSMLQSVAG